MNWKNVKSDFEEWRKKFLTKKDYKINDKRRNLEPTGNEKPPDVYGVPHNPIIVERPGTQCYSPNLSPQELHDLREAFRPKEQSFIEALKKQLCMVNEEYLKKHINDLQARKHDYTLNAGYLKPLRDTIINKHDIYNIRIALELANDVNDFIKDV